MELLFAYSAINVTYSLLPIICTVCMLCIIILSVIIYDYFCSTVNRAVSAETKARMLVDSKIHQEDIKSVYQVLLKNQHDFKHRLAAAEALLNQQKGKPEESIRKLLSESREGFDYFLTGNETMDAVLTAKKANAEANGITFLYQPYPLKFLPIDDVSFCILISNLLDNAIHEVSTIPASASKRYVELKFAKSFDMFSIRCNNPTFEPSIDISKKTIKAKNVTGHGYGLESIRQTVEKNQGLIHIYTKDYLFSVEILLPM